MRPADLLAALDKIDHIRPFLTLRAEDGDFENLNLKSPYEPETEATSNIHIGEMFTGSEDPTDAPWNRGVQPRFRRGVYGFHAKVKPRLQSRHQRLAKLPVQFDLMAEIMDTMAKSNGKYKARCLPRLLRGQFGPPKRIHKTAWAAFKDKYDQMEGSDPVQASSYEYSVQ